MVDFFKLAKPWIRDIQPYVPGKLFEGGDVLKLASNENLLGISDAVRAAIIAELDNLHYYPDDASIKLREKLALRYGCGIENIVAGNGAVEMILYIAEAFLSESDEMIMAWPGFPMYNIYGMRFGATRIRVPVDSAFKADLNAMLSEINDRTKIVWLDNPNNPCGTYVNQNELDNFLSKIPKNVIVVLDDAYHDFAMADDFPDVTTVWQEYPNVVVLRTFAKIYAIAGVRIGIALGSKELIEVLFRMKGSFNVNRLAQVALMAALDDQAFYELSLDTTKKIREYMDRLLTEAGLFHPPSFTNFFLFDTGVDFSQVNKLMIEEGVFIRPMSSFGLTTYGRVSLPSTYAQADRFIETLTRCIATVKSIE